jgi:preprotein translocase subunit YajC
MPGISSVSFLTPLLAQGGQPPAPAPGGELFSTLFMLLPLILLFYFMILRPQQQQERKRRQMINALKPNDKVLTAAGIYGTVVNLDPEKNRVTVRVADGVKLSMTRNSIVEVLDAGEKEKDKGKERADEVA